MNQQGMDAARRREEDAAAMTVNRVAYFFEETMSEKPKPTTAERTRKAIRHDASVLQENLGYELELASMSPEDLLEALCEQQKNPDYVKLTTIERWLNGTRKYMHKDYRQALADLFGYADPDSILKPTHKQRRDAGRPNVQNAEAEPDVGEFVGLLQSFGDSSKSSPEADAAIALEVLKRPKHGTYLSIAIHWLNRRSS